ncbi:MAG: STAS domain-containing protein [Patescibacteria group bacterium]
MTDFRRIEVEEVDGIQVVTFKDNRLLDEGIIQVVGDEMFGLVEEFGATRVVLDCTGVGYMSSVFYGKIITLEKKIRRAKGKLATCNCNERMQSRCSTSSSVSVQRSTRRWRRWRAEQWCKCDVRL